MSENEFAFPRTVSVRINQFDPQKLLISAPEAGSAIGFAIQTTRNMLWTGTFPIPTIKVGRRAMVRVCDLLRYVEGLQPVMGNPPRPKKKMGRLGRPTKAQSLAKALAVGVEK